MAVSPRQIGFSSVADRTIQACLKQLFDFCEALRAAINGVPVVTVAGGDFTPILNFGGAPSAGATFASQIGKWRQIGPALYHWRIRLTLTNKGAGAGIATFTGFPIADAIGIAPAVLGDQLNFVNPPVGGLLSGTTLTPFKIAGAGSAAMLDTDFNNNSEIIMSGTVFIS